MLITLKVIRMLSATWASQQTALKMRNPHLGFGLHMPKEHSSQSTAAAEQQAADYSAEDMPAGF